MEQRIETTHPMTDTLVSGDYYLITGDHATDAERPTYSVTIGTPAVDSLSEPDKENYYCPVDIEVPKGSGEFQHIVAFGINDVQALEMAYQVIKKTLSM